MNIISTTKTHTNYFVIILMERKVINQYLKNVKPVRVFMKIIDVLLHYCFLDKDGIKATRGGWRYRGGSQGV